MKYSIIINGPFAFRCSRAIDAVITELYNIDVSYSIGLETIVGRRPGLDWTIGLVRVYPGEHRLLFFVHL